MCGICGIVHNDRQHPVDAALLQAMTNMIQHRGPDDEGHWMAPGVGLGSRRLSIVGLGDGHMPMSTEDQRLWVVYNGELYNHPELKKRLEGKGYSYRTHSDTETLLYLYREYGDEFLHHTQGMFALALWDVDRQRLILARDRLGIKPLYYQYDGKTLRFASEIKQILLDREVPRELDLQALNFFLCYLCTSAPATLFRSIRQLCPGEMMIFSGGKMDIRRYWNPRGWYSPQPSLNPDYFSGELLERMRGVVRSHLLSDVPVGAFLSGGIDSSVLVALMNEELGAGIKTFSIGFKGNRLFDETAQARLISERFQTDHEELLLAPDDLLGALEDITWQLDEPLADSSCLPVYFVSKLAAGRVKVVLSGDGGDEIFAGYRKYQAEYFRRFVQWMPDEINRAIGGLMERTIPESRSNFFMDYLRQVKKFFRGLDPDPFQRHFQWAVYFEDAVRHTLLRPEIREAIDFDSPRRWRRNLFDELPDLDSLNRMLWVDLRHNLPDDMLRKVDRMSMLHSLEVRVPFLDHTLVEWAFSLPGSLKLRGRTTKWILKEAFRGRLPEEILNRRKHGFDVPVGEWFRHELRDMIEEIGSPQTVNRRGLFDPRQVARIIKDHQDGKRDYNNQLWILLSLELWQRRFVDSLPGSLPSRPCVGESL